MPTASDYARRSATGRVRAGARNKLNVRPMKVRFSKKKYKRLVEHRVPPEQSEAEPSVTLPKPAIVTRPATAKRQAINQPPEDLERKEALCELKKSLEQFEKLHKKICLLCYGDRMEGGTSGNCPPDESPCPGEEDTGSEIDKDSKKDDATSGSEKAGSDSPRSARLRNCDCPCSCGKPKCECAFTPKRPKRGNRDRAVCNIPAPDNCNKCEESARKGSDCKCNVRPPDRCSVKSKERSMECCENAPAVKPCCPEPKCTQPCRAKPKCPGVCKCKKKTCRCRSPRPKPCGNEWNQCQGFFCKLAYCCFHYVLIFPGKEALSRAKQCTKVSGTSPHCACP